MYITSLGVQDISGIILIEDKNVTFYVIEEGYITLPIVHTENPIVDPDTGRLITTIILAKKDDIFVTIFVRDSYIEYWYERKRIKLKRK